MSTLSLARRAVSSLALLSLSALAAAGLSACEPAMPPDVPENDVPPPPPAAAGPTDVPVSPEADRYADTDPSALSDFRPTLDAHGAWVEDPTYGTVWVPAAAEVGPDFAPYMTAGHWAYDNDEYVWVSDYDWGWAPFHYGRWVWVDGTGWEWIPGRVYAGAWVTWRVGDEGYGYVGWAPMPPLWYWYGGVAMTVVVVRPAPFYFCGREHLFAGSVSAHILPRDRAMAVASSTHVYATPGAGAAYGHPSAAGPSPASLGHTEALPHASSAGTTRAQAFARPSTAAALGGKAPVAHSVKQRAPSAPAGHPASAPRGGGGRRGGRH